MSPINSSVSEVNLEASFLAALEKVLPIARPLALHEPVFNGSEWKYVKECIDSGWVSSVGKFVDEFECRLANMTGSRYAVATVNGTAALHVGLKLVNVNPGDEVLVPALTFVATANAVAHCGATPHFVDSDERTLGIDPYVLRDYLKSVVERSNGGIRNKFTGRRIAALVPMHTFGHPADLDGLLGLATDWGIPLVEDAAEALGSYYKGQHTGSFGAVGVLSFNGNKIITTGGGGAILTQNSKLAKRAKHLTTTAKLSHRWAFCHDEIAWNYRLPNLNAALGCAQLEKLDACITSKRSLAARYRAAFSEILGMRFLQEPMHCRSNYWLNTVLLDTPSFSLRDRLLEAANNAGFMVRPAWTLLNKLPMYQDCPAASLTTAENLEARIINLPSGASLELGVMK